MNTEQERAAFEEEIRDNWGFAKLERAGEDYIDPETQGLWGLWKARAALQAQDREDALIETVLDACDEWSGYVEVDNAPRTLREHVKMAIDHARRIEGEEK